MENNNRSIQEVSLEHYQSYRIKEYSGAIAKPVSLEVIINICREENPKSILEIGGGMGTITHLLLKETSAHVDTYEPDLFCIEKMREHLKEYNGRFEIIESYRILPPRRDYDLIIVDGGTSKGKDSGYSIMIWLFIHYLENVKIIFVEGNRTLQKILIRKALSRRFIYSIKKFPAIIYNSERLPGGTKITCSESASRIYRWLNYIYWEIREQTAIIYFIRYQMKRFKFLLGEKKR